MNNSTGHVASAMINTSDGTNSYYRRRAPDSVASKPRVATSTATSLPQHRHAHRQHVDHANRPQRVTPSHLHHKRSSRGHDALVLTIPSHWLCPFYSGLTCILVVFLVLFFHAFYAHGDHSDNIPRRSVKTRFAGPAVSSLSSASAASGASDVSDTFDTLDTLDTGFSAIAALADADVHPPQAVKPAVRAHAEKPKHSQQQQQQQEQREQLATSGLRTHVPDPVPVHVPEYWTIFVALYSYRSEHCISTVQSLLINATYAARIHVGVYEERDAKHVRECSNFDRKCDDLKVKRELYMRHLQRRQREQVGSVGGDGSDRSGIGMDRQGGGSRSRRAQREGMIGFEQNMEFLDDVPALSKLGQSAREAIDVMEVGKDGQSVYKLSDLEETYYQRVCMNVESVETDSVAWQYSQGDAFGRFQSEAFYDEETFVLSIDANFMFVQGWDVLLIQEWAATNNEFAVLTTHPKPLSSSFVSAHAMSYLPVVCNTYFVDWSLRQMMQNSAGSIRFRFHPVLTTLYAQAFSFSKGHRLAMVRSDPHYDSLVDGNDFDMALRLFTYGYDFYAPHVFALWSVEQYEPKRRKQEFRKQWQYKWKEKNDAMIKSTHRLRRKVGIKEYWQQDEEFDDLDEREMGLYGLGDIRSVEEYLDFAGIDLIERKIVNRCTQIREGKLERVPVERGKWRRDDIDMLRRQEVSKNEDHA